MRPVCLGTLMWRSRNKLSVTKSTASYATSPSMMDEDPKRATLTTTSGSRETSWFARRSDSRFFDVDYEVRCSQWPSTLGGVNLITIARLRPSTMARLYDAMASRSSRPLTPAGNCATWSRMPRTSSLIKGYKRHRNTQRPPTSYTTDERLHGTNQPPEAETEDTPDGRESKWNSVRHALWSRSDLDWLLCRDGGRKQANHAGSTPWLGLCATIRATRGLWSSHKPAPTLTDLELAFRRVAKGKATGPDHVPGELCHVAPEHCARVNYTALWKMLLFGHEALQYKGGLLVQAYKGSGEKTQCASYPSLWFQATLAKPSIERWGAHRQPCLNVFYKRNKLEGEGSYGVHLVRAFMRQARHQGRSCALIMLDPKEAFYRILRPLCMRGKLTDESLDKLMQRLQMPPNALHTLHQILQEPSALESAGMARWEQRSMRAVHSQTHFWMRKQTDVVQTTHGSRPGDPFADVIFSYVWAIVLEHQAMLSHVPQRDRFPVFQTEQMPDQHLPFLVPTWMDDLAVCLEGESPEQTIRKAGIAAGRLLELCTEHAMSPNLKKNKTEILFSLQGPESRKYKKLLYGPEATGVLPVINEFGTFEVAITTRYRHLGGVIHHTADQKDEIRRRVGIAHGTLT